jgi:preprotein translocase subunit SecG
VTIFLTVLHVMVCVVLIVVVLLQRGKGAEIGAVFGGGASTTVFGSRGAGNFLTKLTTGAAVTFMLTSLVLSYIANTRASRSIFGGEPESASPTAGEESLPFTELSPSGEGALESEPATESQEDPALAGEGLDPSSESP